MEVFKSIVSHILDFDQTYFVGRGGEYDSKTDDDIYDEKFYEHFGDFVNYVRVSLDRFCKLKLKHPSMLL